VAIKVSKKFIPRHTCPKKEAKRILFPKMIKVIIGCFLKKESSMKMSLDA